MSGSLGCHCWFIERSHFMGVEARIRSLFIAGPKWTSSAGLEAHRELGGAKTLLACFIVADGDDAVACFQGAGDSLGR
ncbi:hypothetical protein [Aeoliella sp. SH292]|uniref:hypothetical protein n=1 Tax=Aeoliella sp. SH292 TaxID=3454464 RepID=UPI003F96C43C